jgi:hypothetical protein
VTEDVEAYPHAPHWKWALHSDGTAWPVGVLPRAEVLSHLWRSSDRVSADMLNDQTRRLVVDFAGCDSLGVDSVARCEAFVCATNAPSGARDAVARRMIEAAIAIVDRDPAAWSSYCAKPIKLAPAPGCVLAELLAPDVQQNLDWEIEHQNGDGSWEPNWTWDGAFPVEWAQAKRWWSGEITLKTLLTLRAYGRL